MLVDGPAQELSLLRIAQKAEFDHGGGHAGLPEHPVIARPRLPARGPEAAEFGLNGLRQAPIRVPGGFVERLSPRWTWGGEGVHMQTEVEDRPGFVRRRDAAGKRWDVSDGRIR